MNIIEFFKTFETNEQAVEYLEKVRWPGKTICPYCKGETTCCHKGNDRKIRRWQCWVAKDPSRSRWERSFIGRMLPCATGF